MNKKSTLSNNDLGFFGELWQQAKLAFQLFLDPQVPIYLKLLPIAAVAYLLFPFDFLPDVVPGLGQLDDLTILLIGAKVFIELAPQDVVAKYLHRIKGPDDAKVSDASPAAGEGKGQDDDDIIEGIVIEDDEVKE